MLDAHKDKLRAEQKIRSDGGRRRLYSRLSDSFVCRDDEIRLAQIIARMNEQQFYREAAAEQRRITINRISTLVHPSPSPVVRLSVGRSCPQQLAWLLLLLLPLLMRSVVLSIPHRPFSVLLTFLPPLADKNRRRIGPRALQERC